MRQYFVQITFEIFTENIEAEDGPDEDNSESSSSGSGSSSNESDDDEENNESNFDEYESSSSSDDDENSGSESEDEDEEENEDGDEDEDENETNLSISGSEENNDVFKDFAKNESFLRSPPDQDLWKEKTEENNNNDWYSCKMAADYPQNPSTGFHSNYKQKFSRIIGGNPVPYGDAPWQAFFDIKDVGPGGGGTLISEKYVITAAHVMSYKKELYTIILGEHILSKEDSGEVERKIAWFEVHSKYDSNAESTKRKNCIYI